MTEETTVFYVYQGTFMRLIQCFVSEYCVIHLDVIFMFDTAAEAMQGYFFCSERFLLCYNVCMKYICLIYKMQPKRCFV